MATAVQKNIKQNYSVPSQAGTMIPANPLNLCLKFTPPTIAVVYSLANKTKKYVHEIVVDLKETSDLNSLCDELFVREKVYLNPSKISK